MESRSNFGQALWLGVSSASSIFVSLISVAILSRYLDKIEYGTYKQIIFVYTTLLVVFQAGLPNVFSYFLPKYSHREGKYIVGKVNQLLFLLGCLLSLSLYMASGPISVFLNNPELAKGLKLFSPFPLFVLPTLGIEGIYIVNKNTKFIAIYNTVTRIVMLLCIVLPVVLYKNEYEVAIVGWGVASFFAFLIALRYKGKPYADVTASLKIDGLVKKLLAYSLPIMGSGCVLLFYNSINQILISRYYGTAAFADFSNGYLSLPFIAIIVNPIRNLFIPIFSKAKSEGNLIDSVNMYNRAIYEMGLLIIPACIFCFFFSKEIMVFLYGVQYEASYVFFHLCLIFNLFEIFPMQVPLTGMGKTKELLLFDVVATLLLLLADLLFIHYQLSSPFVIALAFTIMQILLRNVIPYLYLRFANGVCMVNRRCFILVSKVFVHSLLIGGIVYFGIRAMDVFSNNFIKLLVAGVVFLGLLLLSGKGLKIDYMSSFRKLVHAK